MELAHPDDDEDPAGHDEDGGDDEVHLVHKRCKENRSP